MEHLAERLAQIPGVVAVTLGGSRARGRARADSDWDFGLYYRNQLRAADVRALGLSGEVGEPGQWGRIMNGGAWLVVDDTRVDLIYRHLDTVLHCLSETEAGRFDIDPLPNDVVTADGELRPINAVEEPDLFWGCSAARTTWAA